jgi:AcrR family transcriptional regulator
MPGKTPYHHGHLREALLGAATSLIAEAGPRGVTLREIARKAGVSHNAPYRHFRDKEELVAAVAVQGFRELDRALRAAVRRASGPRERLKACGLAYVSFALRRPAHFTVMFDVPVGSGDHAERAEAAETAFGNLMNVVTDCLAEENRSSEDPLDHALFAWSLVHGIAKLAIAGRLPFRSRARVLAFAGYAVGGSAAPFSTPR